MITVLVPVGPHPANHRWLAECLSSVAAQTLRPSELLLLDDTGDEDASLEGWASAIRRDHGLYVTTHKMPRNLGVAHAFNMGVALAEQKLVFMLGSDDTLDPVCLERCYAEYGRVKHDDLAYYYVGVRYLDTGETQTVPCHAAMITKALWRLTGGFPVQSAVGAPDAALLSIMFAHYPKAGRIRAVANAEPLYNYRRHAESDTARKAAWQRVILETRDLVTREWRPGA